MMNENEEEMTNLDKKKISIIMQKIIIQEVNNLKTKEKSDSAMAKEIQKIIEEEVKCY